MMGSPVSSTAAPRTRPSVVFMATARTDFDFAGVPRDFEHQVVLGLGDALVGHGQGGPGFLRSLPGGNSTSTTGPMTEPGGCLGLPGSRPCSSLGQWVPTAAAGVLGAMSHSRCARRALQPLAGPEPLGGARSMLVGTSSFCGYRGLGRDWQETIHCVRDQTDRPALVRETTKLEKLVAADRGLCPFHSELLANRAWQLPLLRLRCARPCYCHRGPQLHRRGAPAGAWAYRLHKIERERSRAAPAGGATPAPAELYDVGWPRPATSKRCFASIRWRTTRAESDGRGLVPTSPTDAIADASQAFRVGYAPYGRTRPALARRRLEPRCGRAGGPLWGVLRRSGPGHYDCFSGIGSCSVLLETGRVVAFSLSSTIRPKRSFAWPRWLPRPGLRRARWPPNT